MSQTPRRRGRPALFEDPRQLSLYVEGAEVEELLAAKPESESRASYLLRLVKAGLAALAIATAPAPTASAAAQPTTHETAVPVAAERTEPYAGPSLPDELPVLSQRDDAGLAVLPSGPMPEAPQPSQRQTDLPERQLVRSQSKVPARPTTDHQVDPWQSVLPAMRAFVGEAQYEGFLAQARYISHDAKTLTVGCISSFFVDQLTERFTDLAEEQLAERGTPLRVSFVLAPQPEVIPAPPKKEAPPEKSAQEKLLAGIPALLLASDTVLLDLEARGAELAKLNPNAIGVANEQAKIVTAKWDRVKRIKEQLADGSHPFLKGRKLWGPDPFRRRL